MDLVAQTATNEEEWKPLVRNKKVIPNYWVSNSGRIKSFIKNKERLLKISNEIYEERGNRQTVSISIPSDLFTNYLYKVKHRTRAKLKLSVHRAVMETFKPIDDFPPIPKHEWDSTPESARKIIRECCLVDHIDDNPFNNNISNLRWVTPRENNSFIKKYEFSKLKVEEIC